MTQPVDAITLSQALIQRHSVTPDDAGCQPMIAEWLKPLGYQHIDFSQQGVSNSYYCREKDKTPMLWYVGHTDVVPTGDPSLWAHPPFSATIDAQTLHGRGAVDMKGGIACFLAALMAATQKNPNINVGLLITSDEEGPAQYGIKAMLPAMKAQQITPPKYCLVGEPSSKHKLGDTIKIGRRGSLTAKITITGKQGHVAYPHLAINPIHACTHAISQLNQVAWDQGNEHFDPTQCQVVAIESDTKVSNIIPNQVTLTINFRYSPETDAKTLQEKLHTIFETSCEKHHQASVKIQWHHSGRPFYTPPGFLVTAMTDAINDTMDIEPTLSTSGGTSDGRFIAPLGCEVIEMGLLNKTIHQINEQTSLSDLHQLSKIYEQFLLNLYMGQTQ